MFSWRLAPNELGDIHSEIMGRECDISTFSRLTDEVRSLTTAAVSIRLYESDPV